MEKNKKILDVNDIAELLKCSVEDAQTLITSKVFAVLQIGSKHVVLKTEFDKWISRNAEKAEKTTTVKTKEVMKIGKNLRKVREDAGLSIKELSEIFEITDSAISHWENSDNNPSIIFIKKYHMLFGTSYDILLKEK
jgi:ribosome-binding protein aMBF1 (putative translation factor)